VPLLENEEGMKARVSRVFHFLLSTSSNPQRRTHKNDLDPPLSLSDAKDSSIYLVRTAAASAAPDLRRTEVEPGELEIEGRRAWVRIRLLQLPVAEEDGRCGKLERGEEVLE